MTQAAPATRRQFTEDPAQALGTAMAEAVGVDPTSVRSIALVIKPGHWPVMIIRRALADDDLGRLKSVVERHHIIGIKVKGDEDE